MRATLVVIGAPDGNGCASLGERSEPVLVQAFVSELAVEAYMVPSLPAP
jgi:hypothetical protein